MIDRLLRALLVIGGVSAACAWTWPGAFPEGDPVAVLVRYHTPTVYAGVVAWYYVAPGVAALLAAQFSRQHVTDLVRPDGRHLRVPIPAPQVAAFAHGRRPGHRHR